MSPKTRLSTIPSRGPRKEMKAAKAAAPAWLER
jgi:hypothetical protein